jgi:tRNA (guanine37-N1)-methyltransferase
MRFDVLTLFPDLFGPFRATGVLGRAVETGLVEIVTHDLRDWADNRWRQVDDEPYGGGAGMVIQAPPVLAAIRDIVAGRPGRTVMLSPRGRLFDQQVADELAGESRVLLVCGRYEGIDERVAEILQPDEISVGDFVLGGGEVAAMVVIEAVTRLLPGVVGDPESVAADSFFDGLLDHPAYTRPPEVEGHEVPDVLRSGNHEAVRRWRLERAVTATVTRRPDLINRHWDRYPHEVRELVRRLGGGPDGDVGTGDSREAT